MTYFLLGIVALLVVAWYLEQHKKRQQGDDQQTPKAFFSNSEKARESRDRHFRQQLLWTTVFVAILLAGTWLARAGIF